ncbi:MAG: hypothetical protein ACR2KU_14285 [Gammaproteobacteria bacterium]
MNNNVRNPLISLVHRETPDYSQLETFYDEKYRLMWCYMQGTSRPCFTPSLLAELNQWCKAMGSDATEGRDIRYHVLASNVPAVFNLGGDLGLFTALIRARNKAALYEYAKACIDALYGNMLISTAALQRFHSCKAMPWAAASRPPYPAMY